MSHFCSVRRIGQTIATLLYVHLVICFFASVATADWPSLLGPTRNGIADGTSQLPASLSGPPKQIWKLDAGQGYSGPAVAGNDLVLFERVGDTDRVRLLNAESGQEVWRRELKANYRGGVDSDKGPRSMPTILNQSVLVYSAAGDLTLLSRKDGSVQWTRALRKEYEADDGYFGAGSTPLVVGEQVIVNVGGKKTGVVSVSLRDGKSQWTSLPSEASYASPIILAPTPDSKIKNPIVVVPGKLKTLGLDLGTGQMLWSFPFGQRGPTVNAATPILNSDGNLFITSSYGIGSLIARPAQADIQILHQGTEISSQYCTPVIIAGKIFGSDGREDAGGGSYKCLSEKDGKLLWEHPEMPICHTIGVRERLLIVGIGGEIWAIDSSATKFQPLWSSKLPMGRYRALPAFSGDRLYTRTSNGASDSWYCFQIGSASPN